MTEDVEFRTIEELRAENKKLKKELEGERQNVAILKDCARFFLHGEREVKQRGVVLLKEEGHPVQKCCQLLKLSSSRFYEWTKQLPSKRNIKKDLLNRGN